MKFKNIINLFLITLILLTSLTTPEESKDKTVKKEDKNTTKDNLDDDDDDSYDFDDDDSDNEKDKMPDDMFETDKFEKKIYSICDKFNIKKDSKVTKSQLKEVFIYLFKEEQPKQDRENSDKKEDKYELMDTILNEAFNRLTYDLEPEDITYEKIPKILALDKASKIMLDIYTQMIPDDEL